MITWYLLEIRDNLIYWVPTHLYIVSMYKETGTRGITGKFQLGALLLVTRNYAYAVTAIPVEW